MGSNDHFTVGSVFIETDGVSRLLAETPNDLCWSTGVYTDNCMCEVCEHFDDCGR